MVLVYPATYNHNNQSHTITIQNDGKQLSFELKGHYFYGRELSAMQTDDVSPNISITITKDKRKSRSGSVALVSV